MTKTSWLAFISEFSPLVSFFIAGQVTSFFNATAILMITTVVAVALSWIFDRRIPWLPIISAVFVLLGGTITLLYRAPDALILADTFYYSAIAIAIGISLMRGNLLLKTLFETVFAITPEGWRILTWRWLLFLILLASANEIARFLLTPESWITYRLFKSIIITLFGLYQFTLARRHRIEAESNRWGLRRLRD